MKNFTKLVFALICLAITSITQAQISGTVFRDFNGNGFKDNIATFNEPFVAGITVQATLANGTNFTTSTNTAGAFTFTVGQIPAASQVRIEFSGLSAGDYSALKGTGNGTDVQFATAPSAIVNYAISYPKWYSGTTDPWIATNRFTAGLASATGAGQSGTFPNLVVLRHSVSGDQSAITTTAANQYTGSVFGLTYQKQTRKVFMAAYLKRFFSFGTGGVGGIYTSDVNQSTGVPSNPGLFVNLSTIGITVGADPHVGLPNTPGTANNDAASWPLVGKRGIGGIDLSDDGKYLYVVNMNPNGASTLPTLHRIFINNPAVTPTAGNVTTWNIPTPTLTGATTNFRPMAIKVWKGRIFVGGVCIKETSANQLVTDTVGMKGVVYEFNENTGVFTVALSFPLTYKRPYLDNNENQRFRTHYWGPWQNSTTATVILNDALSGNSTNTFPYGSQPMLSNIEFDVNGDMLIGMRDRFGDQMGWVNYMPVGSTTYNAISSAEILRAGNCSVSTWTIESNAAVCSGLSSGGNNLPGLAGYTANSNNVGPGGGLYYFDTKPPTFNHQFRSNGGLAVFAGSNTLTYTAMDPDNVYNTGGIAHIYNSTLGANTAGVIRGGNGGGARLYNDVAGTTGKAGGMGDCELLTDAEPVQVGNRIWTDTNGDGIQDANETGLTVAAGTTVTLRSPGIDGIYGNGDDQTWTTTTDATGNYFFSALSSADNRKPAAWTGIVNTLLPGYNYRIEMAVPAGLQVSKKDAASGLFDNIDNDAVQSGANAYIVFNTSNTSYSYDFGFKTLATLGDKIWRDDNKNATQDAGEPGISGITIILFRPGFGLDGIAATADDALPVATTVTDSYGNYLFDNLTPGNYQLQVSLPANYQFTTQSNTVDNTDGTATKDVGSDVNATTGLSYTIALSAGENERNIDAGLIFNSPAAVSSIGDKIWYDTNGNGSLDAGEPGVSNVTVTLYKETAPASGVYVVYATTVTDVNGLYLFNNLPNNTNYKVGITPPAGTSLTTSTGTTPGNATTNSDLDPLTRLSAAVNIPPVGAQITGIDAGLILQLTTRASLGDRVWYDNNRDGDQDAGEPGIAGVTVQLLDAANVVLATTTTDAFGTYIFTNLNPGVYRVSFGPVAGMQRTALNSTGGTIADITDSDADPTTGRTQGYTLNAGGKNMSVDAGYYSTQPAINVGAIGDRVWVDNNGNGIQDAGEPSVAGVTVTLYNNAGTAIAMATTDINGNYLFPGLTAGNYTIGFSNIPAGFGFSGQNKGGNAATDGDPNPATGRTQTVIVTGGTTNTTVDAGIRQGLPSGLGSLGNKVFIDLPGGITGQQEAGELGVSGVIVQLYLDANGDGAITAAEQTAIATTTTNALGEYLFAGLNTGTYQVGFSNLPASYTLTVKDAAGIADDEDSDGNPVNTAVNGNPAVAGKTYTDLISLAQGEDNLSVDLGLVTPANTNSMGNFVWFDADADGIQDAAENGVPGVMVTLYNNAGTAIAITTTDATGQYLFTGLADGNYSVGFSNYPAGFDLTVKSVANDLTGSDADRVSGRTALVTLNFAAGGTNRDNRSLDAGLITTRAALGDKVFSDLNNNGTQDIGEYGIAGVTVSLFRPGFGLDGIAANADDALAVASMITDGKGNYFFSNLIPGDYQLEFSTIPGGMLFTQQNTPGDNQNNTNSDAVPANVNGRTGNITLSAGETDLTVDAGLTVPRPATIGNRVWDDFNANGIQDANEPGVGGILVTLYNSINQPTGSAVTDGNGNWQITNISAGNGYYTIFSPNLPAFNTTVTPGSNPAWTTQNLGANGAGALDSGTESDVDSDVTATGANAGRTAAFNIVSGDNFPNIDAGIINWARGNVLPIQLVSFTAQPQGNNVQLNWVVATEINVAKYEVIYSTNGTNFNSIGSQLATGSRNYSQLHTSPQPGLNYYRLKVTDIDGSVSYSEIRKVNFGKTDDKVALYPVPAKTFVNITFSAGMINKPAIVSILSIDGKLQLQQTISALSQTETINVSKLASGKYIVSIMINDETINRQIEVIR